MKKKVLDLAVIANLNLNESYVLLKLSAKSPLPHCEPGQFAELRVDGSSTTFLRRPISINWIDRDKNEIWFLIQKVGDGTKRLAELQKGDLLNTILPLGNTFNLPSKEGAKALLIGGGVGVAPLLMLGKKLVESGFKPSFLLGARSGADLLQLDDFARLGEVFTTTEDGSQGEKGYVVHHSILESGQFDAIYTCGPKPMMVAVAHYAKERGIYCQASLENTMACGFGACLCCVENTTKGHICACTEGPVFNVEELLW